jgi:hypothetical protein
LNFITNAFRFYLLPSSIATSTPQIDHHFNVSRRFAFTTQ